MKFNCNYSLLIRGTEKWAFLNTNNIKKQASTTFLNKEWEVGTTCLEPFPAWIWYELSLGMEWWRCVYGASRNASASVWSPPRGRKNFKLANVWQPWHVRQDFPRVLAYWSANTFLSLLVILCLWCTFSCKSRWSHTCASSHRLVHKSLYQPSLCHLFNASASWTLTNQLSWLPLPLNPCISLSLVTSFSTWSGWWSASSESIHQGGFPLPTVLRYPELGCSADLFHFHLIPTYQANPPGVKLRWLLFHKPIIGEPLPPMTP